MVHIVTTKTKKRGGGEGRYWPNERINSDSALVFATEVHKTGLKPGCKFTVLIALNVQLHLPFSSSWQGYEIVSHCNSIRHIFGV